MTALWDRRAGRDQARTVRGCEKEKRRKKITENAMYITIGDLKSSDRSRASGSKSASLALSGVGTSVLATAQLGWLPSLGVEFFAPFRPNPELRVASIAT